MRCERITICGSDRFLEGPGRPRPRRTSHLNPPPSYWAWLRRRDTLFLSSRVSGNTMLYPGQHRLTGCEMAKAELSAIIQCNAPVQCFSAILQCNASVWSDLRR